MVQGEASDAPAVGTCDGEGEGATMTTGPDDGLWGNVSGIGGNISGIWGNISGIWGDVDDCGLTEDERKRGVEISELVDPSSTPKEKKP